MPRESLDVIGCSPVRGEGHLLNALGRATAVATPYDYWLLSDLLPTEMIAAIGALPFAPPIAGFDGRRETNNASRHYFTPETRRVRPVIGDVIDLFSEPAVIAALSALAGVDLAKGRLRIEYCQDVDGFWLEPHVDIAAKLITLLIYVSDDPRLADAGTDVYDASPSHRPVARAPSRRRPAVRSRREHLARLYETPDPRPAKVDHRQFRHRRLAGGPRTGAAVTLSGQAGHVGQRQSTVLVAPGTAP